MQQLFLGIRCNNPTPKIHSFACITSPCKVLNLIRMREAIELLFAVQIVPVQLPSILSAHIKYYNFNKFYACLLTKLFSCGTGLRNRKSASCLSPNMGVSCLFATPNMGVSCLFATPTENEAHQDCKFQFGKSISS